MFKRLSRLMIFIAVFSLNDQYTRLFYLGAFGFTPKKIATLVLLALASAKAVIQPHRMPRNAKNLCIAGFAGAAALSYAMSFLMGIPLRDCVIGATSLYAVILLYYLIVYMVADERDLEMVIWAAILGAAMVGFTALTGIGEVREGVYTRSGGLGRNPNLAATYSVTGLTLGFLLFLERPRWDFRRLLVVAAIGLTLFGVLASLSRTGFLCILAVVGFLMVRMGRLDMLRWGIPLVAVLALVFVLFAPEQYFERIGTMGEQAQELAGADLRNRRILSWWEGLKAFGASPIVGVGRLSFRAWIANHNPSVGEITPHNSYIHVLSTMGLLGFLPWAGALVINWRDFSQVRRWQRMFRTRRDPVLSRLAIRALFLQSAFLVWLVASLVSPFADDEGLWLLLALGTVVVHLGRVRARELAGEEPAPELATARSPFGAPAGAG